MGTFKTFFDPRYRPPTPVLVKSEVGEVKSESILSPLNPGLWKWQKYLTKFLDNSRKYRKKTGKYRKKTEKKTGKKPENTGKKPEKNRKIPEKNRKKTEKFREKNREIPEKHQKKIRITGKLLVLLQKH